MKWMKQSTILVLLPSLFFLLTIHCEPDSKPEETVGEESTNGPVSMDEDIKKGRDLFVQDGCSGCHGDTGHGDGKAGKALDPKPRNFHAIDEYKQGHKMENIVKTIETGIPGTAMVAYPHIPQRDRELIAKYIIYLQGQP